MCQNDAVSWLIYGFRHPNAKMKKDFLHGLFSGIKNFASKFTSGNFFMHCKLLVKGTKFTWLSLSLGVKENECNIGFPLKCIPPRISGFANIKSTVLNA